MDHVCGRRGVTAGRDISANLNELVDIRRIENPRRYLSRMTTCCCVASQHASSDLLTMLLDKGARTDVTDGFGDTPLHKACRSDYDHVEKARLLLRMDCRQVNSGNQNGTTPLHIAAKHRDPALLAVLLAVPRLNVNAVSKKGLTALHVAAHFNRVRNVEHLLAVSNIDVNGQDVNGDTAAHHAAFREHRDVHELIAAHPKHWAPLKNRLGQTAADCAQAALKNSVFFFD